jgi:hypothetical protein
LDAQRALSTVLLYAIGLFINEFPLKKNQREKSVRESDSLIQGKAHQPVNCDTCGLTNSPHNSNTDKHRPLRPMTSLHTYTESPRAASKP